MKTIHQIYHKAINHQELLDEINEDNINDIDDKGYTLLQKACYNGQPNLVRTLIEKGANIFLDSTIKILVQSPYSEKSLEIFQILTEESQLKHLPSDGKTAISLILTAVEYNNIALADEIFKRYKGDDKLKIQEELVEIALNPKNKPLQEKILKLESVNSQVVDKLKSLVLEGSHQDVQALLQNCSEGQINHQYDGRNLLTLAYEEARRLEKKVTELQKQGKLSEENKKEINLSQDKIISLYKTMNILLDNKKFKLQSTLEQNPEILQDIYVSSKRYLEDANPNSPEIKIRALQGGLFSKIKDDNYTKGNLGPYKQNLLNLAAKNGDNDTVLYIRKYSPSGIDILDELGNTPLLNAASSGSKEIFDSLVKAGASVTKNKLDGNILMAACAGHNSEIIGYALTNVSPKDVDKEGSNAFHYLSRKSDGQDTAAITKLLLEGGVPIDQKNKNGLTPLMMAVINNNVGLVNELLSKGADINAVDKQGNTALIYACALNKQEMIGAVLSANNLDVTHKNNQGFSAYLIASQRDLLQNNETIGRIDIESEEIKCEKNTYPKLAKTLLLRGADPYVSEATTLFDIALFSAGAIGLAKVGGVVSDLIKDEKIIGASIVAKFVKYGSSLFSGWVLFDQGKKLVKKQLNDLLNMGNDNKISLGDRIMIGSIHDTRFAGAKHGDNLKKGIANHDNFTAQKSEAIYSIDDLKGKIERLTDNHSWVLTAHNDLTNQYISVQHRIRNQPWYYIMPLFWKGNALKEVSNNITEAHKILREKVGEPFLVSIVESSAGSNTQSFETKYKDFIKNIESPKSSKSILKMIVEGKGSEAEELLDRVLKKEIFASPQTYESFLQFDQERKRVVQSEQSKRLFLEKYKQLLEITIDTSSLESFKEKSKAYIDCGGKTYEMEEAVSVKDGVGKIVAGAANMVIDQVVPGENSTERRQAALEVVGNVGGMVWAALPNVKGVEMKDIANAAVVASYGWPMVESAGSFLYSAASSALSTGYSLVSNVAYDAVSAISPETVMVVGGAVIAAGVFQSAVLPAMVRISQDPNVYGCIKKPSKPEISPSKMSDLPSPAEEQGRILDQFGAKNEHKKYNHTPSGNKPLAVFNSRVRT